jgi:precorrin-6B methylase 2
VVELGCGPRGCLDLLAERVGPEGTVVGIERSPDAVAFARQLVTELGFTNVEVGMGDARATVWPTCATRHSPPLIDSSNCSTRLPS